MVEQFCSNFGFFTGTESPTRLHSCFYAVSIESFLLTCHSVPLDKMAAADASSQGSISPVPGDVILTTFGVAVVTRIPQGENEGAQQLFEAKLWRMPFKSIGSSTTGFLRMDTVSFRCSIICSWMACVV
jgi:hypothetical protein